MQESNVLTQKLKLLDFQTQNFAALNEKSILLKIHTKIIKKAIRNLQDFIWPLDKYCFDFLGGFLFKYVENKLIQKN